jgi:hypothetical protein
MKKTLIILIFFLGSILLINEAQSQISISVKEKGWSESIDGYDLESGPGSNLLPAYENTLNQISIEVTGTSNSSDSWRVDIKKTNITWNNNLVFSVKRTSDGSGNGSIDPSGSSYLDLTNIDQTFFSGSGNRNGVYIRYKFSGVSVLIPPKEYKITITYTIVDT